MALTTPATLSVLSAVLLLNSFSAYAFSSSINGLHQETVSCLDKNIGETFTHNNMDYLVVDDHLIRLRENQDALVGNILRFCTSHVTNMRGLFEKKRLHQHRYPGFNADISDWDTRQVTDMSKMFFYAEAFNQPIGNWDTAQVTNMANMFRKASSFNQPIGDWDTANVTDMSGMFHSAGVFNQPIGYWDTSNVTDMRGMFYSAVAFNQDIGDWDTSKVTHMTNMFEGADAFSYSTSSWYQQTVSCLDKNIGEIFTYKNMDYLVVDDDLIRLRENRDALADGGLRFCTSHVTDMSGLFSSSDFNQDIGNWDTGNVTDMSYMFAGARIFDQELIGWDVYNVEAADEFSSYFSALKQVNRPRFFL
ncbi:exported hypothetical protein [Vibrio chagasii]|nr:exported hypothetical protein [Vibrio chagasii]